jgi:hypothetical protein
MSRIWMMTPSASAKCLLRPTSPSQLPNAQRGQRESGRERAAVRVESGCFWARRDECVTASCAVDAWYREALDVYMRCFVMDGGEML